MSSLVKGKKMECLKVSFFEFLCTLGVFIVGAKRTPFGTYGGKLANTTACELQTIAAKAALQSANVNPELVDTVNIGNVLSVRKLVDKFKILFT